MVWGRRDSPHWWRVVGGQFTVWNRAEFHNFTWELLFLEYPALLGYFLAIIPLKSVSRLTCCAGGRMLGAKDQSNKFSPAKSWVKGFIWWRVCICECVCGHVCVFMIVYEGCCCVFAAKHWPIHLQKKVNQQVASSVLLCLMVSEIGPVKGRTIEASVSPSPALCFLSLLYQYDALPCQQLMFYLNRMLY